MEIGRPEDLHGDSEVRILSIERAISQYQFITDQLKSRFVDKVDQYTVYFLKGYGNEINILSTFRELFFNSRELLDSLLLIINKNTKGQSNQTPREFLPFAKHLMNGTYDQSHLIIFNFLKINFTYIFHIRKIRNEIKNKPSNIKFRFVTDHFEAYFRIPINKDETEIVKFLDIENKDEALLNMSYHCTYNLDELFPEMLEFWKTCFSILEEDLPSKNNEN